MTKFEELLSQYGKVIDDIDFEYEGLTDEELEAKFAEVFADAEQTVEAEAEQEFDGEGSEPTENEVESEPEQEQESIPEDQDCAFTVQFADKQFSASISQKLAAITSLVNETYADDCTYYSVDMYEDDGYCIMIDCYSGRGFKQACRRKKGDYVLVGDRVPVFSVWCTEDEMNKLDEMRNTYAQIKEEVESYRFADAHAKRLAVMQQNDFAILFEQEDYKNLFATMDNYTEDELENNLNLMLGKYTRSHQTFAKPVEIKKSTPNKVSLFAVEEEDSYPLQSIFTRDELKK